MEPQPVSGRDVLVDPVAFIDGRLRLAQQHPRLLGPRLREDAVAQLLIHEVFDGEPRPGAVEAEGVHAGLAHPRIVPEQRRTEEHTSELQSLMRTSYAVFCL